MLPLFQTSRQPSQFPYLPYGESLNENLLHLLENSASDTVNRPTNPVVGQIWFNKSDNTLYVCYQERAGATSAKFRALANSSTGAFSPPNPNLGDLWFDTNTNNLKVYLGTILGWRVVGPAPQADWTQVDNTQLDYIKNKPAAFTPNLTIKNKGTVLAIQSININFTGAGVTASLVGGTSNSIEVNIPGAASGATLPANASGYLYNNGAGTLSWSAVSAGASALANLTDVDTTGAAIGNVLKYITVGGVDKWRPVAPGAAASTSFTLATTDGSAKSMGVVLTPGTWQVILDTRLTTKNDYNHDATMTQSATVGSVTVTTEIKTNRGGGAGHGRSSLGATDIAVGEFTLTVDTPIIMAMAAAVPGDEGMQSPVGSTLTVSKIKATDAQNLYSGTVPTFTIPSASGVGVGQTWQNVKTTRAADTIFTNSTGAPIMVALSFYLSHDRNVSVYINNLMILSSGSPADDSYHNLTFIVPNNSTYKVTTNGWGLDVWTELR